MEKSLKNLTEHILSEAKAQANSLLQDASESVKAEREKAQSRFDALLAEQTQQLTQQSQQRIADAVRLKTDKLNKERTQFAGSLIDQLFEQAQSQLAQMPADEFIAFYRSALAKLALKGEYTVVLGALTAKALSPQQLLQLAVKEEGYSVTVDEKTIPNQGGFVLEQSPIEYSFLFADMLDEIRREQGPSLLKRLID